MTLYSISFWMRKEKQLLFTLKNLQFGHRKSTGAIRCLNHKLLKINQ